MKRIKIRFCALFSVISAILCFALVGCAQDGEYVEDSLEYDFSIFESWGEIKASYSFYVNAPDITNYEVEYQLIVYDSGSPVKTLQKSTTVAPTKSGRMRIGDYTTVCEYFSGAREENLSLKVTNVTVKPKEANSDSDGYAIGFGVAGGAVLIACTVLFIVYKVKEKK